MFSLANPVETFISATKQVLLTPVYFYRSIFWQNVKIADSLFYTTICSVIGGLLGQIQPFLRVSYSPYKSMYSLTASPFFFLAIVYTTIYSVIYLILSVAFIHLFVKAVYRRQITFSALLAAIAAVSATELFSWLPVVGPIAGFYALVLTAIAIREVERVSTGEAIIVVVALIVFIVITAKFVTFPWIYGSYGYGPFFMP